MRVIAIVRLRKSRALNTRSSMASDTTPPPPKTSGTGYVAVGIGMLIAMGGLIFWKVSGEKDPGPEKVPEPAKVEKKAPVFNDPPPPPPPIEEVKDAEPEQPKKIVKSGGSAPNSCSGPCEGTATGQLQSALRAKGGQARGCYERALRLNPTLEGRIMVAARLGSQGQVCSANVTQNSLGDATVASCISQMFRSGKFPAPKGGCVDVQVPLNFVAKK